MKLLRSLAFAAVCAAVPFCSFGQNSLPVKTAFEITTSKLEPGGLAYSYVNTQEVNRQLMELMKGLMKFGDNTLTVSDILDEFFLTSGMNAIQGIGSSTVFENGMYRAKHFICVPASMRKGFLFDMTAPVRPAEEFAKLVPSDAIFACGSVFQLKPGYDAVLEILRKKIPADEFQEMENELKKISAQGMDIPTILDSVTGMTMYVSHSAGKVELSPGVTGATLILETKSDFIYRAIRSNLPPDSVKDGIVRLPELPLFLTQSGKYLIVSTDIQSAMAQIASGKSGFTPIHHSINGFLLWTPEFGGVLQNSCANLPPENAAPVSHLISFFGFTKNFQAVATTDSDGFLTILQSEAPLIPIFLGCSSAATAASCSLPVVTILAGMTLPVRGSILERSEKAKCMNNFKQICTAMFMYDAEHDILPAQDGIAGLDVLIKEMELLPELLVCPASGKKPAGNGQPLTYENCSYMYFGGASSANMGPGTPILMDLPGNHKNGFCYTRLDCAVLSVDSGTFTTAESQVREILKNWTPQSDAEKAFAQRMLKQATAWDAARNAK